MTPRRPTRSPRGVRLVAGQSALLRNIERRAGITPSGLVVLTLVVMGFLLGRLLASKPVFLVVYGLLALVLSSWLLGRRQLSVQADRSQLPTRVRQGQAVDVQLVLTAKRRVSTVVLEEELHADFGRPVRMPVPLLPAGDDVQHSYTFSPTRRGVYQVGPLVAEWSDPFGLTRRRQVIAEAVEIIVHPASQMVHDRVISREWEDPPVRPPVSKPWPSGFEFYGMREYVNGDDPRRIVWRAVARTYEEDAGSAKYLVRVSEQGITDRVSIYLDTDHEHYPMQDGRSETFESAVQTAASLGVKHLKDGFSVSLDANAERKSKALRGQRDQITLLDTLAAVQPEKVPLLSALDRLFIDPNRTAHNVIITPELEPEAAQRLRLLRERGTSMLLVLIISDDTDPATLHRAGTLGINVVEVAPNIPLDRQFLRVVGGRK